MAWYLELYFVLAVLIMGVSLLFLLMIGGMLMGNPTERNRYLLGKDARKMVKVFALGPVWPVVAVGFVACAFYKSVRAAMA